MADGLVSAVKQEHESMVTSAAHKVPPFKGTSISTSFLKKRMQSWQAHLRRISNYLEHGEEVWWKRKEEFYCFLDSDTDPNFQSPGPLLMHFRDTKLPAVENRSYQAWKSILESSTACPPNTIPSNI